MNLPAWHVIRMSYSQLRNGITKFYRKKKSLPLLNLEFNILVRTHILVINLIFSINFKNLIVIDFKKRSTEKKNVKRKKTRINV